MQRYDHKLNYIGTGEYVSDMEPSDSGEFYLTSEVDARIAELEQILRRIVDTAHSTCAAANHVLVHRELVGEANRLLMESGHG